MKFTLIKGRIAGEKPAAMLLQDETIVSTDWTQAIPKETVVYDFGDSVVLPGFIDPHVHGGGGYDFVDMTEESFSGIMNTHVSHGTTSLCPTLVSCNWQKTVEFLSFCEDKKNVAGFAGVHLEGPFLSPEKSGAQNPHHLFSPSRSAAEELLQHRSVLNRITVAPELSGAEPFAKLMKSSGVSLSIGHSAAGAETVRNAVLWGFDQVTHLFCGTSQRYKIGSYVHGGIEETALTDDSLTVELIADGHHVCKESFDLTLRCKGSGRIVAVSDAMRAAGVPHQTESFLGEIRPENRVVIEDGVAKLPDKSSFAGSIALGDQMFRRLHVNYGIPVADVSRMMSEVPARMLGIERSRGKLAPGMTADVVVLNQDYQIAAVFQNGELKTGG